MVNIHSLLDQQIDSRFQLLLSFADLEVNTDAEGGSPAEVRRIMLKAKLVQEVLHDPLYWLSHDQVQGTLHPKLLRVLHLHFLPTFPRHKLRHKALFRIELLYLLAQLRLPLILFVFAFLLFTRSL